MRQNSNLDGPKIYVSRVEKILLEPIKTLESKVASLIENQIDNNVEEVSLTKATKLIHRSSGVLIEAVENKELEAMIHFNSKGKIRYRFRVCDLYDWQKRRKEAYQYVKDFEIETPEEMANRIFPGRKKK